MFATDSEGLCAQCKMKGRLQICPVFKQECHHAKDLPLPKHNSSQKGTDKSDNTPTPDVDNELN